MKVLRRTPEAEEDLFRLYAQFHKIDPDLAEHFLRDFQTAGQLLTVHPQLGRKRNFIRRPDLRSWNIGGSFANYLIFYVETVETVDIIRILHGAMDLPAKATRANRPPR